MGPMSSSIGEEPKQPGKSTEPRRTAASLLSAALALPGLASGVAATVASMVTHSANAESAPETGSVDLKYLYYRDTSPAAAGCASARRRCMY